MTLRNKSLAAVVWSGADVFLRRGLQFFVSIALARLLTPTEFGTIALLYLFTGLASVFADCGVSSALIQRQDVTHADESTAFWLNVIMGFSMAMVLWLSAPLISRFYGLRVLVPLTKVLAFTIIISAFGGTHRTLLTKRLDFMMQMKIGAIATGIAGVVAIWTAWRGFGMWALAAQTLSSAFVTTVLLWRLNRWRPRLMFSCDSARRLFGFGSFVLLSGMLDTAYLRIYTVLIGKFFGVSELGFYNRADATTQLPVGELTGILSRVALPIFSTVAHDKEQLRRGVRHALRGIMLISTPVMFGFIVTARSLVVTLFGSRWMPAVPILQVLCLGGVLWPLHVINLNVLLAQGHSNLFFRLEVAKKAFGMGLLALGTFHGVMGIAWSQVVFAVIAFFINAYYTHRFLDYGPLRQIVDFLPVVAVSAAMASAVGLVSCYTTMPAALLLGIQVALGVLLFLCLCVIFRLQALQGAWRMACHRLISTGTAAGTP